MNLNNKITINYWFNKFHKRPLYYTIGIFCLIWLVFMLSFYLFIKHKQVSVVNQTADMLSISLQTNNRILSEALIDTLLSQHQAVKAKVCSQGSQILAMNNTTNDCRIDKPIFNFLYSSLIPGSTDSVLTVEFSFLKSMSIVFYILTFCLLIFVFIFYFMTQLNTKIKSDIIDPIINSLLSSEQLGILELEDLRQKIILNTELQSQKITTLAIQENNLKVAHDIRSPVTTLEELLGLIDISNSQVKNSISKSIRRIKNISNQLLQEQKQINKKNEAFAYNIRDIVLDLIAEKNVLHSNFLFRIIDNQITSLKSYLSDQDLLRILSNLVDNAIRASNSVKKIDISLSINNNRLIIQITDYGVGIDCENLKKIGTKFFSTEKSGSGLGIYSAKKTIESIDGTLNINSVVNQGTTVSIQIPILQPSTEASKVDAILIDNDDLVRDTWVMLAEKENLNLLTFSSYSDFICNAKLLNANSPVFIDSNLGLNIKGEDKAVEILSLGFSKVILQSGYNFSKAPKGVTKVIGKSFFEALAIIKSQPIPTT